MTPSEMAGVLAVETVLQLSKLNLERRAQAAAFVAKRRSEHPD